MSRATYEMRGTSGSDRLALFGLLFAACSTACSQSDDRNARALDVAELEVELSVFSPDGSPSSLDVDLASLTSEALGEAKNLQLAGDDEQISGPRLRVHAQISPDGRHDQVHAMLEGKLDRTDLVALSWEVDQTRELTERESEALDGERTRAQIEKGLTTLVGALDEQVATARLDRAGRRAALREGSAPAKLAAARSLSTTEGSERGGVIGDICKALDGAPSHLEAGLVEALEELGTDASVLCLAGWAGTDERRLDRAIGIAEKVGGAEARGFLERVAAAKSSSKRLKTRAATAVDRVSGEEARNKRKQHGHEHEHESEDRNDPLIKALTHEDREVRVSAAKRLATDRRADAVEPLCALLGHSDRETVTAALTALSSIGSSRAIPCLLRWSEGDNQRIVLVIQSLVMIGGPESAQVLEMISHNHESEQLRQLAGSGLEQVRARPSKQR